MQITIDLFRFKKLDWYILKQYVGPFLVTFFVAWFVLIMQFLWLYIDDLIGKGVGFDILYRFITYTSASLVPAALPLAILLSSIMTMGQFGENSELTAAKSTGISLFRFFKSTIVFSIFVAIFAFYFSNYIYTKTKSVASSMLYDIRNLKPTLLIKPKQFYNGISGVTIQVDAKNELTGELYNVKIYNHSKGNGNESVLVAKRANLAQSDDGKVLIFKLDTGIQYTDEASNSFDNLKYPFYITSFTHYEKRFDLTQFQLSTLSKNPDEQRLTMTIKELNFAIDSMSRDLTTRKIRYDTGFKSMNPIFKSDFIPSVSVKISDSISRLSSEERTKFKLIRSNKIRNVKNSLFVQNSDIQYSEKLKNLLKIEWHRKFTLAISCIVLFFVGAPLGAIIKKGGIGLPMLLAVILFIIFYFSTMIGSKLAEQDLLSPWEGMWMSTFIFLPFGIFLTYKAMNDSQIMNIEGYGNMITKLVKRYANRK